MLIGNRRISESDPTYIIAELSCNHGQSYERAAELVRLAHEAGADCIKLQTLTPDTITLNCSNEHFKVKGTGLWDGETLHGLYQKAYTPWEWHRPLKELVNSLGMDLISTPFSVDAVDFLEDLGIPAFKVASFENTDEQLLKRIARTKKPVIMSTGMTTWEEICESVKVLRDNGCTDICLLKCTSAYPALPEDANLNCIQLLKNSFGTVVGLSDHTLGIAVSVAAVVLGARVVEKHFCKSRDIPGPDSAFSLEPAEFKEMISQVRIAEKALGKGEWTGPSGAKEMNNRMFRRSLFVANDIKKGEVFTDKNVRSVRPSNGLRTKNLTSILGMVAAKDLEFGTPMSVDFIADDPPLELTVMSNSNSSLLDELDGIQVVEDVDGIVADDQRDLFFCSIGEVPVGICLKEYSPRDEAYRLTWSIASKYRGKGYGKRMVLRVAQRINYPVVADVPVDDIASLRIAELTGMKKILEVDGEVRLMRKY